MKRKNLFGIAAFALAIVLLFAACPNSTSNSVEPPDTTPTVDPIYDYGAVYVAGWYRDGSTDIACYWRNRVKTDLDVPSGSNAYAESIAVSGDDVFVAGYYRDVSGKTTACYWENETKHDLDVPSGSNAYAYFVYYISLGI
jgi:uncharacterized membrane protein